VIGVSARSRAVSKTLTLLKLASAIKVFTARFDRSAGRRAFSGRRPVIDASTGEKCYDSDITASIGWQRDRAHIGWAPSGFPASRSGLRDRFKGAYYEGSTVTFLGALRMRSIAFFGGPGRSRVAPHAFREYRWYAVFAWRGRRITAPSRRVYPFQPLGSRYAPGRSFGLSRRHHIYIRTVYTRLNGRVRLRL